MDNDQEGQQPVPPAGAAPRKATPPKQAVPKQAVRGKKPPSLPAPAQDSSLAVERVTPQSLESEWATLGAMLMERAAIKKAKEILVEEDFYRELNQKIYNVILYLYHRNEPVDLITVVEELRRRGQLEEIGGAAYVTALIENCPTSANVESYAKAVLEMANKRSGLEAAQELTKKSYNGIRSEDLVEFYETQAANLRKRLTREQRYQGIDAADLLEMDLPEPRWAIPNLLPQGLSIFAGPPKLGKSWMILSMGLAVAAGGHALGKIPVEKGETLYIALEDTQRRAQDRIRKLLPHQAHCPRGLTLFFDWSKIDRGGLEHLDEWLTDHPKCRIVVIDVLRKIRPPRNGGRNIYDDDSDDMDGLKDIADKHGVAIVLVHHVNKIDTNDPFISVSGSFGLTGAVDAVWVLRRRRGQQDATLFVSGRDVGEQELALTFDKELSTWTLLGELSEHRVSYERQEVLDLLAESPEPLSPMEVAQVLERNAGTVRRLLWSMVRDGEVQSNGFGKYTICGNAGNGNASDSNDDGEYDLQRQGKVLQFPQTEQTPSLPLVNEPVAVEQTTNEVGLAPADVAPGVTVTGVTANRDVVTPTAENEPSAPDEPPQPPQEESQPPDKQPPAPINKDPYPPEMDADTILTTDCAINLETQSQNIVPKMREFVDYWRMTYETKLTPQLFDEYFQHWLHGEEPG